MREKIRSLSPRSEFFLIITICFGYYVISSLVLLLRGSQVFQLTSGRVIRGIVMEIALLCVAAWILRVRGWDFRRLGLAFRASAVLAGIPLVVVYMALYWVTYLVAFAVDPRIRDLQAVRMIPAAPVALFAVFLIVNSAFEEAIVAAYIVTALSEQGAALSITASTLIRFLYHLYQGPIASIAILPLGLLFAAVYWRWRNLWPLMTAHTILNLLSFWAESAK